MYVQFDWRDVWQGIVALLRNFGRTIYVPILTDADDPYLAIYASDRDPEWYRLNRQAQAFDPDALYPDIIRVGTRTDVEVLWVLTFDPPLPRVWEQARVYETQDDALDAAGELHVMALREHGIKLETRVQAAPVVRYVDTPYPESFHTDPTSPGYIG